MSGRNPTRDSSSASRKRSVSRGRRWGRLSGRRDADNQDNQDEDYYINDSVNNNPPQSATSTLTGNISKMFRRAASRERRPAKAPQPQLESPPTSPRSSSANPQVRYGFTAPHARGANRNTAASVASSSVGSISSASRSTSRIVYSSNSQEDSEDTDSDAQTHPSQSIASTTRAEKSIFSGSVASALFADASYGTSQGTSTTGTNFTNDPNLKTILRYRGFSTSIENFFLDEALVCASMGCFGLFLSNRTEYLLQLRNDNRGVRWGRSASGKSLPSRIVAYALLLTLILIAITFVVWGFGNGPATGFAEGFFAGYARDDDDDDYYNANNNNNNGYEDDEQQQYADDEYAGDDEFNDDDDYYAYEGDDGRFLLSDPVAHPVSLQHPIRGVFKLRDAREGIWEPALDFLRHEWQREEQGIRQLGPGDEDDEEERQQQQYDDYVAAATYSPYTDDATLRSSEVWDMAAIIRASLVMAFLIILGVIGRRRRMRTRYYLVRARAQEDHLFYASSGTGVKRVAFQDSREDQYEGACSHTMCGCYPVDPPKDGDEVDDDVKVDDGGVVERKKRPLNHDCVSRAFSCLMACCCGFACRCWFQCMSICALAQEAREIRLLVPTRYQRLDYITHQPFHEYQKDVNDLRRGWLGKSRKKSGIMPHFNALSRLSRYILVCFTISFLVIVGTLIFNPRAAFSWPDAVVLIVTFLQSFFVIFVVHWIFHKSDLSLDAVIKFFAAGFLIAVPSAFVFEGLLVNITVAGAYAIYSFGNLISDTFITWVFGNNRLIWIFGEMINAYIVAALTEELCKYYTFRCVEHPDLIFLTGLGRSSQDERSMVGGMVEYPFGSHQVQETNKRGHYDDDDKSVTSRSSHRSTRSRGSRRGQAQGIDTDPFHLAEEEEFYEDDHDVRTYRQKAAAVTTGMICVAVGLSCAENFIYVFLLGGTGSSVSSPDDHSGGVIEEWIVLLFRSLFPVHALAAAMQSINVIRKFVESDNDNGHRVGVGRIVLPAVIMHGTFDAVLLAIDLYIEYAWDRHLRKNEGNFDPNHPPYNPIIVNLVAWMSIVGVMLAGVFWYYRENRAQQYRLILLEEKEKSTLSDEMSYRNPEAPGSKKLSEVELV
eukprot:Nitzschia sp. Nitz4//scaffold273_size25297//11853//15515//NITZ4_008319-RA/size25297-processed-gene-0.6-mRNA-1//-1//CDS//3329545256//5855//frame0